MFYSIILIGLLRMLDGADKAPKAILVSLTALLIAIPLAQSIIQFGLIIASVYLALTIGWGKYLTATGEGVYNPNERESVIVDYMIKYLPKYQDVVGMSLRWFIYSIPLGIVTCNPLIIGLLLIGPLYYIHRYHHKWWLTELLTGSLFGALSLVGGNLLCIL